MAHPWEHKIHLFSTEREWTLECVQRIEAQRKREREWREKVTAHGTPLGTSKFIFSQLQSTRDIWSFIMRMEPLRKFPHGDIFVLTLSLRCLNSAEGPKHSSCVYFRVYVPVRLDLCRYMFVCAEEGLCLKSKVCLRLLALCTHTHMIFQGGGRGEVKQGTAICKSICFLQISFLLWDFGSHNSLAFPSQFPSDIGCWGPEEGNPFLICVSMGQKTERRCVSCLTTNSPGRLIFEIKGTEVMPRFPLGTTNFTTSNINRWPTLLGWWS